MVERAFGHARGRQNFCQADAHKTFVRNQSLAAIEELVFGAGGGGFGSHAAIVLQIDRSASS